MKFLPIVTGAEYRGDLRIHITFQDGIERTIDFAEWIHGPTFEQLRDREYFQQFSIDGGTVTWPNGADIAPETLYARATAGESPRAAIHRRSAAEFAMHTAAHSFEIRAARAEDAPELARLLAELGYPATDDVVEQRLGALSLAGETVLVGTLDGRVLGCVTLP